MTVGRVILVLAGLAAAFASLVLIANTPVFAIPGAPIDDGLFVRLGTAVRETGWLGEFDELTLAKGMAYPVLLAIADALSVQAKVAEHLVYLAGAASMGWVVSRLSGRPVLGVVLFVVLAFDPTWVLDPMMRIRRETMYAGVGLLVVAGVAWVFLVRGDDPLRAWRLRDLALALLVGLAAGVFWLVREEGIWLAPSVGLIAVVGLLRVLVRSERPGRARSLVGSGVAALALVVGFVLVVGSVIALNGAQYGVAVVNDFRDGAFPRAVGAFTRIEEDPPERYVQVSQADLAAAYAASPAVAELEPFLSVGVARYLGNNCRSAAGSRFVRATGIEVNCEEVGYGWFPWALRTAMGEAGYWDDGEASQAFLERLAAELDAACEDGRLSCGPPLVSTSAPLTLENVRESVELFPDAFTVLSESHGPLGGVLSRGTEEQLRAWERFIHGPVAPPELGPFVGRTSLLLTGFVASPSGTPEVRVERGDSAEFVVDSTTFPDPKVLAALSPEDAQGLSEDTWTGGVRYRIETDCVSEDCMLVVGHGNGTQSTMQLPALQTSWLDLGDGTVLRVAEATYTLADEDGLAAVGTPRNETVLGIQRGLDDAYATVLPWLSLLGVLGCLAALLVPSVRRRWFLLGTLTVAAGVAVLARFGIIGLLEVAGWPGAMSIAKLAPASPFLITFAVLGTYLLVQSVVAVISSQRQRRASLS